MLDIQELLRRFNREKRRLEPDSLLTDFQRDAKTHGDVYAISRLYQIIEHVVFSGAVAALADATKAADAELDAREARVFAREERLRQIAAQIAGKP